AERIEHAILRTIALLDGRDIQRQQLFVDNGHQIDSHATRSPGLSSVVNEGPKAPLTCSAILPGVQPSERCITRIGRGWLNRNISLLRTAKTCPEIPSAASEPR